MNLYLLTGTLNDYDTFDACVVVAEDEESARTVHPKGWWFKYTSDEARMAWEGDTTWTPKSEAHLIKVKLVGVAADGLKAGDVVCASFNAG